MEEYKRFLSHRNVEIKDIPNIDLYMDQLTGYIESVLEKFKVYEEDKILTKTMINNYVKAKVIDKPDKKKYNKNHIMELIMIYHLKNILSINEIDEMIKYQKKQHEEDSREKLFKSTEDIYKMFLEVQEEVIKEANINFDNNINNYDIIKHVLKLVLEADINKRLAEIMLKEIIYKRV